MPAASVPGRESPRSPRRWLRISLRASLLALTVLALAFGWYANRALRQKQSAASIVGQGGKVFYRSQGRSSNKPLPPPYLARYFGIDFVDSVVRVDLLGPQFDDQDLALLCDFPDLEWLQLYETKITGSGFAAVPNLRRLKEFDSIRSPLTDEGLSAFAGSTVRSFDIDEAAITDRGVTFICNPSLQKFSISGMPITDKALESVARCTSLERFWAESLDVTDNGISKLSGLKSLTNVRLRKLQISDEGLAALRDHPNLEELKIELCPITDTGLENLGRPPRLEYFKLQDTLVTRAACDLYKAKYGRRFAMDGPPRATVLSQVGPTSED